jgi:hypothetical protein
MYWQNDLTTIQKIIFYIPYSNILDEQVQISRRVG